MATGRDYCADEELALASSARWGALILDGDGVPQAAAYVIDGAQPGDVLACISAAEGWRKVRLTLARYLRHVLMPALEAAEEVRRVLAVVAPGDAVARRYVEGFGFRPCAAQPAGWGLVLERRR